MLQNLLFRPIELDDLCRNTTYDAIWRHIFIHHCTGSYRCPTAYMNTGEDGHIRTNPNVFFNDDILIETLRLIGFSNVCYELTYHTCVIARMDCQMLGDGAIAFDDNLGIGRR